MTSTSMHPTFTLGDRTLKRIGLGTNRLENTPANREFLQAAVDAGLDFIDTAHLYTSGESERTIGAALGDRAGEVVIATKGGYKGGGIEQLRAELEQSRESLRTDTIELYYLHRVDPKTPIERSVEFLAECVDAGRIRQIGISEVSIGEIDRAKSVAPIAAVQNNFSLDERKHDEVVDYCAVERIPFVPFYPLRGKPGALAEIAERHGATPNQVKLAWLLRRSPAMAPIPGTRSIEHLRENLAALELELTDEEFEALA